MFAQKPAYKGLVIAVIAVLFVMTVFYSANASAMRFTGFSMHKTCERFATEANKLGCVWGTTKAYQHSWIANAQGARACSQLKMLLNEGRCNVLRYIPNTCNGWGNIGVCTTDVGCVSPASAFVEPSPDGRCLSGQGCCILPFLN